MNITFRPFYESKSIGIFVIPNENENDRVPFFPTRKEHQEDLILDTLLNLHTVEIPMHRRIIKKHGLPAVFQFRFSAFIKDSRFFQLNIIWPCKGQAILLSGTQPSSVLYDLVIAQQPELF